ncbi:MAG: SRPBCC domain-containing protein [Firmicutes bacterium]|nr:SRPBCC domain-containing protein [Bacillota bacterium]
MDIEGTRTISAPPAVVFQLLTDPDVLKRTMPGLKSIVEVAPFHYRVHIEFGALGIKERYSGSLRIVDIDDHHAYRLLVDGQGSDGEFHSDVYVTLKAVDNKKTLLHYIGEGHADQSSGKSVILRKLLSKIGSAMMNQFFAGIAKEAQSFSHRSPPSDK